MAGPHLTRLRAKKAQNSQKGVGETPPKPPEPGFGGFGGDQSRHFSEKRDLVGDYGRALAALLDRLPAHIDVARWQQCLEDGHRFLASWSEQAAALGWTARDLFGLHEPPEQPHPSYSRLSRVDCTGLCWLLQGRKVVALTEAEAAIKNRGGSITVYRRHNKPSLGPVGDSLDDFK